MRILFLGDLVGRPARKATLRFIAEKKAAMGIDVVIANSDNLAHGKSVTRNTVAEMLSGGVDILTCGDHAWDNNQAFEILKAGDLAFVCPCNLPGLAASLSSKVFTVGRWKLLVANLMGTVFIDKDLTSPFAAMDNILDENEKGERAKIVLLDFHAEATSEKKAIGRYLEGRVSAVLGTHTHIQTADEEVMHGGTAYITDAGMVGVEDSILGCEAASVLDQYISGAPFKYKIAEEGAVLVQGVVIDIDEETGRATRISRIKERVSETE